MKKNIISQKLKRSVLIAMLSLNIIPGVASAAIAPDISAPNVAVNVKDGVEIIKINEANASGLSHNVFTQFDVSSSGAVFNNSVNDVNSQLAGMINGNSNFVNGIAAQTILNEVVSNNPSSLNGIMEIAGQKANLIIANQKGITGNGLGFINTDRAILTTGNPVLNEAGALTGFNVTEGTVAIAGTNNTSGADTTEILSKKVDVNGNITANVLKVVTGSNAINFADLACSNTNGDIVETGYAIDITAIGGMNGNSIYLVSSDNGTGVKNDGIIYGADNVELTSNGDIINNYAIVSDKNVSLSAQKNVINRKRINANDSININVIDTVTNTDNGIINSSNNTSVKAKDFFYEGNILAGTNRDSQFTKNGTLDITATNNIDNVGNLYAGSNVKLKAIANLNNNGNVYSNGDLNIRESGNVQNSNKGILASYNDTVISSDSLVNDGRLFAGYDQETEKFNHDQGNLNIDSQGTIVNNSYLSSSGEMQLISQGDITNYGSISADNNLTFTASGDVNFVPLTAETELPLVISGKKIAISCNNFLSNADVGSLHDTGVADENARAYGIDIDALVTATIYGNLVSNNGAITVDADQAVIQDAVITSVSPLTSEGFDVTVITNGSINVTNSKLISEKGLKLDSNDKGEIYILNSQITNNGTGPCSFFAQPKITVDNSAITGKGMVALNANYVDIKGLKSSLTSGGDMMIFAFTEIKNTGELISNGYLNMVMSNYGKFNNMGVMLSKDYLQIYGSPVFQNLNILGSQSDISLWGRNAGAAYTGVKAPIVKVNGYDMGLAGNIYALFSPSDLTVKYVIAGIGEVAPGGYGTIGSAASSAYNCYKNNYSEPTTQAIISDTGEFITIEVGKQLLKKAGVVGSGPVIGAALVLKDAIRYEDYSISLDRKFGAYDVLTGDRVLQGGLTDALKFFDKVAGSDKGWQETVNADGIITRVSPDGSVTATLKMPTETQANPIVEFRGSGTEVKYLPYCSDQTVKFI